MNCTCGVSHWEERWANPNWGTSEHHHPHGEGGGKKEAFMFAYLSAFSSFTPQMEQVVLCPAGVCGTCGFPPSQCAEAAASAAGWKRWIVHPPPVCVQGDKVSCAAQPSSSNILLVIIAITMKVI